MLEAVGLSPHCAFLIVSVGTETLGVGGMEIRGLVFVRGE